MPRRGSVSSSSQDDDEEEEEDTDDGYEDRARAVLASLPPLPAATSLHHHHQQHQQPPTGVIDNVSIAGSSHVTLATHVFNVYNQVAPPPDSHGAPALRAPAPECCLNFPLGDGASALTSSPLPQPICYPLHNGIAQPTAPALRVEAVPEQSVAVAACCSGRGKKNGELCGRTRRCKQITIAALCFVVATACVSTFVFKSSDSDGPDESESTLIASTIATTTAAGKSTSDRNEAGNYEPTLTSTAEVPVALATLGYRMAAHEEVAVLVGREQSLSGRGWRPLFFGLCSERDQGGCVLLTIRNLTDSGLSWCADYIATGFSITINNAAHCESSLNCCHCWTEELQVGLPGDSLRFAVRIGGSHNIVVQLMSGAHNLTMSAPDCQRRPLSLLRVAAESGSLCFHDPEVTDGQLLLEGSRVEVSFQLPFQLPAATALYIGLCHPCGGSCSVLHLHVNGTRVLRDVLQSHTNSYLKTGHIIQEARPAGFEFATGVVSNPLRMERRSLELMEVTIRGWSASSVALSVPVLAGQTVLRLDSTAGDILHKHANKKKNNFRR